MASRTAAMNRVTAEKVKTIRTIPAIVHTLAVMKTGILPNLSLRYPLGISVTTMTAL